MKRGQARPGGRLKILFRLPFAIALVLTGVNLFLLFRDRISGLIMLPGTLAALVLGLWILLYTGRKVRTDITAFAADYAQVQKRLISELEVPYGLMDQAGTLLWSNRAMREMLDREGTADLFRMLPELKAIGLPDPQESREGLVTFRHMILRARLSDVPVPEDFRELGFARKDEDGGLIALYLFDETDHETMKRRMEAQQPVAGYLYLDNYDEVMQSVEEVRRSLLAALIDRKINRYFGKLHAVVKSLEKDRYFLAMEKQDLEKLKEDRVSLLEDVKTVSIGNEMNVTLSIGLGTGGEDLSQDYEYAQMAIDMALGRGGDQAVVKEGDSVTYFGGKSLSVEKNTRVKARVKAHALQELMSGCDRVIAMGHKIGDVDCFGAALGIWRAAATMGKKAHIVQNEVTPQVTQMRERFTHEDGYPDDMFLTSAEAVGLADVNNTLVVVVDTNRPQMTECPELLDLVHNIVVLDHHRMPPDPITGAVLSYVEPYASSACEMVAEVIQYVGDGVKIRPAEADVLYSGIVLDTNNFVAKTGVRTFEAAAFLRRSGADITRVRKLFRDSLEEYKARAETVRGAEIFEGDYAISVCTGEGTESPTVTGAQAANELLDIIGVKASFVLTPYKDRIYISARSIDEVNVQRIMENLGGGGHMSVAGAQLTGSLEEAMQQLKDTIRRMRKEGEI